jgi:hypothetical protein|tara:strand:+ start:3733 stop:4242 length:510 start_codon:yes stop_codon:yes gene_type:complete
MSFIIENNITISFADFNDVVAKDQRIFDSNEGLTDDVVEDGLIRATERILSKVRSSSWWKSYYIKRDNSIAYNTVADIPAVDPEKIKARLNDFKDLAIYEGLAEYILPIVADFGNEDNAERQKMGYYKNKAESLLGELITAGDWYDFDGDNTVESSEKSPGQVNLKRIR